MVKDWSQLQLTRGRGCPWVRTTNLYRRLLLRTAASQDSQPKVGFVSSHSCAKGGLYWFLVGFFELLYKKKKQLVYISFCTYHWEFGINSTVSSYNCESCYSRAVFTNLASRPHGDGANKPTWHLVRTVIVRYYAHVDVRRTDEVLNLQIPFEKSHSRNYTSKQYHLDKNSVPVRVFDQYHVEFCILPSVLVGTSFEDTGFTYETTITLLSSVKPESLAHMVSICSVYFPVSLARRLSTLLIFRYFRRGLVWLQSSGNFSSSWLALGVPRSGSTTKYRAHLGASAWCSWYAWLAVWVRSTS